VKRRSRTCAFGRAFGRGNRAELLRRSQEGARNAEIRFSKPPALPSGPDKAMKHFQFAWTDCPNRDGYNFRSLNRGSKLLSEFQVQSAILATSHGQWRCLKLSKAIPRLLSTERQGVNLWRASTQGPSRVISEVVLRNWGCN